MQGLETYSLQARPGLWSLWIQTVDVGFQQHSALRGFSCRCSVGKSTGYPYVWTKASHSGPNPKKVANHCYDVMLEIFFNLEHVNTVNRTCIFMEVFLWMQQLNLLSSGLLYCICSQYQRIQTSHKSLIKRGLAISTRFQPTIIKINFHKSRQCISISVLYWNREGVSYCQASVFCYPQENSSTFSQVSLQTFQCTCTQ